MGTQKKIKAFIVGYPPRKRKAVLKWVDTSLKSLPESKLHTLAPQTELRNEYSNWREFRVRAFGEVDYSEALINGEVFRFEGTVIKNQIEC